jgi:hypothetical protein
MHRQDLPHVGWGQQKVSQTIKCSKAPGTLTRARNYDRHFQRKFGMVTNHRQKKGPSKTFVNKGARVCSIESQISCHWRPVNNSSDDI